MADEDARRRAAESIALRFTRLMNATTSPIGVLCDPPFVAFCTAPLLLALLAALQFDAPQGVVWGLGALMALPLLVALGVSVALVGARARVIEWLAGLPFPVENMNAVLNGLGDTIEVAFADSCPSTAELNRELDKVGPEAFVTRAPDVASDADAPVNERLIEIRIGVVDSKRNPAASNHQRYVRVRALASAVLAPLHGQHKVVEVRIK
jgi:hypothetical protein